MKRRRIVLDANILIRAVLGKRVERILVEFADSVDFCAPSVAFADAQAYLYLRREPG
ncbi:MAG TPA: PIN domain-containing protein [Arachnia sp.]|nr:PIN domain-containing protein [Arachnia sp.]